MSYDLVIRGGALVHPWGRTEGSIAVRGETIAAGASPGETLAATREIDARGKCVLPGRIDPHVHMHWPDWPMEEARVVDATKNLHQGSDFSPFDGKTLTGRPVLTVLRGQVVMEGGEVTAEPGTGRFVPRALG